MHLFLFPPLIDNDGTVLVHIIPGDGGILDDRYGWDVEPSHITYLITLHPSKWVIAWTKRMLYHVEERLPVCGMYYQTS